MHFHSFKATLPECSGWYGLTYSKSHGKAVVELRLKSKSFSIYGLLTVLLQQVLKETIKWSQKLLLSSLCRCCGFVCCWRVIGALFSPWLSRSSHCHVAATICPAQLRSRREMPGLDSPCSSLWAFSIPVGCWGEGWSGMGREGVLLGVYSGMGS